MTSSTLERADGTAYPLTPPYSVRSLERRPLTPAAHTSKGQRTHITGSALALDKKGD